MGASPTDEKIAPRPKSNTHPIEPSLQAYFAADAVSPVDFFKAIRGAKVVRFKDQDVSAALQLIHANDSDGKRLLALAAQTNLPDAVSRWLWPTIRERLATALPNDIDLLQLDAVDLFKSILEMLKTKLHLQNLEIRREGETLLLLALAWLISQRSLDVWTVLAELKPLLFADSSQAVKLTRRILVRGKMAEVKNAVAIGALAEHSVREARSCLDEEARRHISLQAKLAARDEECNALRARLIAVSSELDTVYTQLAEARSRLQEMTQHWGHDVSTTKAEQRVFMEGRVTPLLADAVDALEIEPPEIKVALRRLKSAVELISEAN